MQPNEIMSRVDYAQLNPDITLREIYGAYDAAEFYQYASICVPSTYVDSLHHYKNRRSYQTSIGTVIGFPNGYIHPDIKKHEAVLAINNGADELDIMLNIGLIKIKAYEEIEKKLIEIKSLTESINNSVVLKAIIETCLLSDEEKITMCKVVENSGFDYIKTSTGFSHGGATINDVELLKKHVRNLKIKASGGIRTLKEAEALINAGADRIGTSRFLT